MVPTLWAWGVSTGPVRADALEYLLGLVRQGLEEDGPVDGVLFALHGALVAEHELDGDGYILSRLRALVGESVPIVVTLDLHANISARMIEVADAVVGYDTYPHVDQVERGLEAAGLLARTLRGEIRPVMALEKPPMVVVPHKQLTDAHPMRELLALAHEAEREVLSATVAGGFAYSDVPEVGPATVVVTNKRPELARAWAKRIAGRMWELREEFAPRLPGVAEAVRSAIESRRHPVILADVGDNIGAGTPGDGTFILRELIEQGAEAAVVIIADAEAVGKAVEAGVGRAVTLEAGGKCDPYHGTPVRVEGRVRLISDGVFRNRGHMRDGIVENMGRTAVVESRGVKLVLTEVKMPPWNLEQLRSIGITPEHEKVIALKSAVAFRAAYGPIAGEIIEVNSPGLSSVDLRWFDYKHIRRPLHPLAKSLGYVDLNNVFMHGVSRGGMMVYLTLKNNIPVNAVAVEAGVVAIPTESKYRPGMVIHVYREYIPDFDKRSEELMRERSALYWADKINEPVLILHGGEDWRVRPSLVLAFAQKLQEYGKTYELIIYGKDDHGITLNKADEDRRNIHWFRRHMK